MCKQKTCKNCWNMCIFRFLSQYMCGTCKLLKCISPAGTEAVFYLYCYLRQAYLFWGIVNTFHLYFVNSLAIWAKWVMVYYGCWCWLVGFEPPAKVFRPFLVSANVLLENSGHANMFTCFFRHTLRNVNVFVSYSIHQTFDPVRLGSRPLTVLRFRGPRATSARGVKVLSWHQRAWSLV